MAADERADDAVPDDDSEASEENIIERAGHEATADDEAETDGAYDTEAAEDAGDVEEAGDAHGSEDDEAEAMPGPTLFGEAAEEPVARPAAFGGLAPAGAGAGDNLEAMLDVPVEVTVELGQTVLPLGEVLALGVGSIVELNRSPGESMDLLVNGRLLARGEIVVLHETFGFRVGSVVGGDESGAVDLRHPARVA